MKLIHFLALAIAVIFVLHFAGTALDWYGHVWWFDIPMHIMGGMFIALLFFYVFTDRAPRLIDPAAMRPWVLCALAIGFVAFIGVLWEFYEYAAEVFIQHQFTFACAAPGGLFDTLKDLFDDLVGGTLAILGYCFTRHRCPEK